MMEVKHSPTVSLKDYVSKSSDNTSSTSNIQTEKLDDELLQNGDNIDDELDFHDAIDDTDPINSDLEDALLADDDLLTEPKTNFSLENLDKAENSTDPGDDLDRLLSKINDVVEGSDLDATAVKEGEQVNGKNDEEVKENVDKETKTTEQEINADESMQVDEETVETTDDIDKDAEMLENDEKPNENKKEIREAESKTDKNTVEEEKKATPEDEKTAEDQTPTDVDEQKGDKIEDCEKDNVKTSETTNSKESPNPNNNDNDSKVPTNITENSQDKLKSDDDEALEDGEIQDDADNEILTLVLDDDDDDDEDATNKSANNLEKAKKLNREIDEDEEIVCLDDDDDEDEVTGVANSETDSLGPVVESENKIPANEDEHKKADSAEKTEKPVEEKAQKVATSDAESDKAQSETCSKVADIENPCNETVIDDKIEDSVAVTSSKSTESESNKIEEEKNELEGQIAAAEDKGEDIVSSAKVIDATLELETKAPTIETESASKSQDGTVSKDNETETLAENEIKKPDGLISDNTDNACDGLEAAKDVEGAEELLSKQTDDDVRSEASSCSNLLQEGQAPSESAFEPRDDAEEEDAECEADDGEDVVLLEGDMDEATGNEAKQADDDIEIPPAKKLRLSTDSDSSNRNKNDGECASNKAEEQEKPLQSVLESQEEIERSNEPPEKMDVDDELKIDEKSTETKTTNSNNLKRALSPDTELEEVKPAEANDPIVECASKKSKTSTEETAAQTAAETQTSESKPVEDSALEKLLKLTETKQAATVESVEVKRERHIAVPSNKPIPLYPPPKFEETPTKLGLDFLQRFRKTYNQMTKNDLEEIVLQKVVEALVYENQFADLRLIIEKQEKVIALHRSKLAQLVKQYRDLEMVHTRVVKDMREKNSQYLMPVRITRAVGLQVTSANVRKPDGPIAQIAPNNVNTPTIAPGSMRAPQSVQQQQTQQQPQKRPPSSPQRPQTSNLLLPSSSPAAAAAAAVAAGAAQPVRRGCMQKVTAQRPVNGSNAPPMASIPASSFPRTMMSPAASSTSAVADNMPTNAARVLNKGAQGVPTGRARYSGGTVSSTSSAQQTQQGKSPPQILNRQTTATNNASKINAAVQNKIAQQSQFRRSDSSPTMSGTSNTNISNTSSSYMEQYKNSFNQAMPTVSITPARPKDKSVIDLTDEDEAQNPPPSMVARNRLISQTQMNAITASANNRQNSGPPSLTRIPSGVSVRPQIAPRQLSTMQNQKNSAAVQQQQPTTITTPNGMSITRVSVNQANPATRRLRYSHPAPLPSTPPQAFSPGWKLPPPRPTIRISNLDNGIVISWTMEEALDRHAEVTTYQIYAYQETNAPPSTESWRHVGDVKAMLLPMAVTLTQFQEDQRYFFSVRAMDAHQRYGPFSAPKTWN